MDAKRLNPLTGENYSSNYWTLLKQRSKLAVSSVKDAFLESLNNSQCTVVVGESGGGKTTQIPQWAVKFVLANGGKRLVVCTQPRRAAAIASATRVAEEMDVQLGEQVRHSFRLDDCLNERTVLRYCTDDMLLRETMRGRLLDNYGVIIVDHAHDRSFHTLAQVALVNEILKRSDVKIVVMTSTIKSAKFFQKYLDDCSFIKIPSTSECVYLPITPGFLVSNIVSHVLPLKKSGLSDLESLDVITEPAAEDVNKVVEQFKSLGTLDRLGSLELLT